MRESKWGVASPHKDLSQAPPGLGGSNFSRSNPSPASSDGPWPHFSGIRKSGARCFAHSGGGRGGWSLHLEAMYLASPWQESEIRGGWWELSDYDSFEVCCLGLTAEDS